MSTPPTPALHIFTASYENPDKLDRTIRDLKATTVGDWTLTVIDNHSTDPRVRLVVEAHQVGDPRVRAIWLTRNGGYPAAVNEGLGLAAATTTSPYVVYVDNDCYMLTHGWDQRMTATMDANPGLGMLFATGFNAGGSYLLPRDDHDEVLWGIGCFWMLRRQVMDDVGPFDETLGHQEEVDYQIRARMTGWRMGLARDVEVLHDASASTSPEATERISAGVVRWMNKWVGYFCGSHMNYHSPNVLRMEDWPPNALYLEEWALHQFGEINANVPQVQAGGLTFDLIQHPKWVEFGGVVSHYRNRII